MKIFITGANGQLGSELKKLSAHYPGYEYVWSDLPELDLTDEKAVSDFISQIKPEVILNCAAYTAVDKAEHDAETAFRVNRDAVRFLAQSARKTNAFLVHISTDYVFDGTAAVPYKENDRTAPTGVYGISKLEGERELIRYAERAMIIRTSWLYSCYGHNFVRTMLRLGREKGEVNVVNDQFGCPTYAKDLAETILNILPKGIGISPPEIFHFCNQGITSWFEFAQAIFEISGIPCKVNPIATKDYPVAAKRPPFSALDTAKIRNYFGIEIRHWKESLKDCLQEMPDIFG